MADIHGFTQHYNRWFLVDKGLSKFCDGGDPTIATHGLLAHERGLQAGSDFQLAYAEVNNRSGAAAFCGVGVRIPNTLWKAGQWVNSTTTFTDDTTDAQSSGGTDFPLETTTVNDGFCVFSKVPFNCLSINVVTASIGASVARAARYSVGGAWVSLPNLMTCFPQTAGQQYLAAQETIFLCLPPADWALTTGAEGTGVPIGYYGLNVRATTAGTTAGVAHSLTVHRMYGVTEIVADDAVRTWNLGGVYAPLDVNGDLLTAVVVNAAGTTPVLGSRITALVRARG